MSTPPMLRTRIARLRALKPGDDMVVSGKMPAVSASANKALGAGNYQVRTLSGNRCRVWHLSDEQKQQRIPS